MSGPFAAEDDDLVGRPRDEMRVALFEVAGFV
jgi:hypothetical protein